LINDDADLLQLPSTTALLISGGDERLALDGGSGRTRYGCRPTPDTELVALGSVTASNISLTSFQAAAAVRQQCERQLRTESQQTVYRHAAARVRERLLHYCGYAEGDDPMAILAPSGTDLFMLAANLRRPQCIVLIESGETGGGVPSALLGARQGAPHLVASRLSDDSLRDADEVDAEYAAIVEAAAAIGQRVLLVLTDVSKTGLIAPGIAAVLALRARWPDHLDVLVDACQFRIDPATVRAYLAHGFMLALTGSKFMTGPTFSGALLLPRGMASNVIELSSARCNFGLLLRWEAALAEMARFAAVPQTARQQWTGQFADAVLAGLDAREAFTPLPVVPLDRAALGVAPGWDQMQTVFPFQLKGTQGHVLNADATRAIYQQLQLPGIGVRRFHLGQPAAGALRLCISARMIADLHEGVRQDVTTDVTAALDRIQQLLRQY
jgi:hypothetical protein